ncbi:hypothetical protein JW930_03920 [Candidatus Woesearchaeota archaeon]|nr:hypothetical protein [Candidatus Woesearchaeota archaeon]
MRYNIKKFDAAVRYYKKNLAQEESKNLFVYGEINEAAFFSIAPLSRAVHELNKDLNIYFYQNSETVDALFRVWATYAKMKSAVDNEATSALKLFLDEVEKKTNTFSKIFKKPGLILRLSNNKFACDNKELDLCPGWFVPYKSDKLKETSQKIIKEVFNLKGGERFGIGFELIPDKDFLENPIEDYLDSFAICFSMCFVSQEIASSITLSSSTKRKSMRMPPERVAELLTTLSGLELEKEIDEPVFQFYKSLSNVLKLSTIKNNDAVFYTRGKGYYGKHYFGETIGYPTKNKKSRWNYPSGIIYKFPWYPQTKDEERDPIARVGFTETPPLDVFIDSVNIDYNEMRNKNKKISEIIEGCEKIVVASKDKSNFEVDLIKGDGTRREVKGSDSDVRNKIDPRYLTHGLKVGMMANIPGGESFLTPENVKGKIIGDVVISIDKSYRLNTNEPIVIEASEKGYKILSGNKEILKKIEQKKKEAWLTILEQEKNKSLPLEIVELKKKNFNNIGEFAINTNPNARLCDYLIINEKIANMIHIALGSGFEPDKATEYHMDIVIDSPKQRLDIYGKDKEGTKHWIIKQGNFVV